MFPDKNHASAIDMKKKLEDAIKLGETIKQKRDADPSCNFR